MASINQVQFYYLTEAQYNAKTPKNANDLYFLDNGRLYKGTMLIGQNFQLVESSFPEVGREGILYMQPTTGRIRVWNGSDYLDITKELVETLDENAPNDRAPSAFAVWAAIKQLSPEGLPELMAQVNQNTERINQITDPVNGILKQSKDYTDELGKQVSQNTADISTLEDSKADKAESLAGYNIGDAYTKTEVDSLIKQGITQAYHISKEIVSVLPDVSEAKDNVIYLVPKETTGDKQAYDEYMLINGSFEKIGDTETDLTNYTTRAEVDQKVANVKKEAADDATAKANTAQANAISTAAQALETYKTSNDAAVQKNTDAITAINDPATGILQKAKDYTDNAGKKYATAEQGALAESALQQRDIATGLTNGTISVKGADVKVKGLGSAAYTESSAYDAAGSATIAYNNAVTYVDGLLEWKYE